MRITLLFGFLGAGKTTLLTRLLEANPDNEKRAVIVNEFGAVGVDGAILEGRAIDTVELASGCICCSLKGALIDEIEELIEDAAPDRVVIEASGIAIPGDLRAALTGPGATGITRGPVVTVVDATRFRQMRASLGPFYTEQVVAADILVINKVDLVDDTECAAVRDEIATLAPDATIIFAEMGDIDPGLVLHGSPHPGDRADGGGSHGHDHVDAMSIVIDVSGTLSEPAVRRFFAGLPDTVWRAEGFLSIDGATMVLQHVPGQTDLMAATARDRHYVVFVGTALDENALRSGLSMI